MSLWLVVWLLVIAEVLAIGCVVAHRKNKDSIWIWLFAAPSLVASAVAFGIIVRLA